MSGPGYGSVLYRERILDDTVLKDNSKTGGIDSVLHPKGVLSYPGVLLADASGGLGLPTQKTLPVIGKSLLTLFFSGPNSDHIIDSKEAVVTRERTPPGSKTPFAGYPTIHHALVETLGTSAITGVYRSSAGRYHVFETNVDLSQIGSNLRFQQSIPRESPKGTGIVRIVNLGFSSNFSTRYSAITKAKVQAAHPDAGADERRKILHKGYREILKDFFGYTDANTHIVSNYVVNSQTNANDGVLDWQSDKLNIDSELSSRGAAAFIDSNGSVDLIDNRNDPIPRSAFAISGILGPDRLDTGGTIIHEVSHNLAHKRGIQLLKEWRKTKHKNFIGWLQGLTNKNKIDTIDFETTVEFATSIGNDATEAVARIRALMATLHLHNISNNFSNLSSATRKSYFITIGSIHRGSGLRNHWKGSNASTRKAILSELKTYALALPQNHQDAFKWYLKEMKNNAGSDQLFWEDALTAFGW